MFSQANIDKYEEALDRTLADTVYIKEILDAVQADADEIQLAASTISIIFMDHELAQELYKYSEYLHEAVRKRERGN